jgi:2-amino-4-hydroxy-6-hydroxymethyldihydropteridine diphosphokinase
VILPANSHRAVVAIGSNLGDRRVALQAAVDALGDTPGVEVLALSPVYETKPVGGPEQPDYLNAVVLLDTSLPPELLLDRAHAIEDALQRIREVRWGPRTVDVDVITYGEEQRDDPDLTLPHPRARARAFVLVPWLDIDPGAQLPGVGPVDPLAAAATDRDDLRRRDDIELQPPA